MSEISLNLMNKFFMSETRVSMGRRDMKIVFDANGGGGGRWFLGFLLDTLIHVSYSDFLNGFSLSHALSL